MSSRLKNKSHILSGPLRIPISQPHQTPFAQPIVLYEDNHLLVVNKPAGLATSGVEDRPSVYFWAASYLKERYNKPGNVYVGIVSRLDTVTSGVLVLARTSKAAARLSEQLRTHRIEKTYLAVAAGHLDIKAPFEWLDFVYKDDAGHRMRVDDSDTATRRKSAQQAILVVESTRRLVVDEKPATIVTVRLLTGRKHQIRVQFSDRRHPLWGDRKYGSSIPPLGEGIALHAETLTFSHPTRNEPLTFTAPPPAAWRIFGKLSSGG